jgi:signal transduction histidine kinase
VSDTGVGISPSEQRRIFEQFYRGYPVAPDGTEIDVRGTGLGLFIIDQIVRAHGGCVEVQSKMGEGSEFTIKLPLYTADNDITEMWNL